MTTAHPIRRSLLTMTLAVVALLVATPLAAQDEEYNMEIGVLGGGSFYMGDANVTTPFRDTSKAAGILARYNLNPRMVIKADLAYANLRGTTATQENQYPNGASASFNRNIYEFGAQFEYSFFAYGTAGYKDSHALTPYLLGGAGLTFAPKPAENVFALNIPVGVGVKFKVAPRINIGAEWTMRFTSSDRLDVSNPDGLRLDDPYHITSKGMKNKDSYSLLVAFISYDIFAKPCDCND